MCGSGVVRACFLCFRVLGLDNLLCSGVVLVLLWGVHTVAMAIPVPECVLAPQACSG